MKQNIFDYLNTCLNEDKLSHAFLIESNNVDTLANEIISFLHDKKLIKNKCFLNNMNLIFIEPDGKEIKTGSIDDLKSRFATLPANDKYNIYIIREAEKMNISAANKILKFLEEPNDFIIAFLLITSNSQVLPTIKSRCELLKQDYDQSLINTEIIDLMLDYFDNQNYENQQIIRKEFSEMERSDVITVVTNVMHSLDEKIMTSNKDTTVISANILLLDKILHLLKSNVNIELVLDKMFIELR